MTNESIYDTHHYSVLVMEEPIVDKTGEFPPLSYILYNKLSKKDEIAHTYLPAAIETAIALNVKLLEYFPKEAPIIQQLH